MNLGECLDCLRRDILHDRSDQVAGDSDQLWSDTTLVRYIDMAQRRFARRSLCLRDSTSPITRFLTVANQQDYPVDPSIISILSMRSLGNGIFINGVFTTGYYNTATPPVFVPAAMTPIYPDYGDLIRSSHSNERTRRADDALYWDVNSQATLSPAKPLAFDTDEGTVNSGGSAGDVMVHLYPMPSTDYAGMVMQMRVARLPTTRLTPQDLTVVPEIPEDYHLDMLDYAAYLALRIVDHELGDPQRAAEFQASFDRHVEEARTEMQRKTFAPMRWGFGGSGFSYVGN